MRPMAEVGRGNGRGCSRSEHTSSRSVRGRSMGPNGIVE
jgi:hypothetical protein